MHISCKETIQKEDIFSDIVTGRILHMMIVRIMNHKNIKLQKAVVLIFQNKNWGREYEQLKFNVSTF